MKLWVPFTIGAAGVFTVAVLVGPDWDLPPYDGLQTGYRGTAMVQVIDQEKQAALVQANIAPESPWDPDPDGERAGDLYENVQLLGHLSDDQFNHFMASITEWISPEEGCNYCHNPENLASDEVYTKNISRRMIQMTQTINVEWQNHVGGVGVTCYTCHRGQVIPANYWVRDSGPPQAAGMLGYRDGQNVASASTGGTSLPYDYASAFLLEDRNIRVHSNTALPTGENETTTRDTEWTWALMMQMSEGLGVNCTFCHNSRAFNAWDESPPQRVSAWHGIRMARAINNTYIQPLSGDLPPERLGPHGDPFKVNCSTCHNGVNKPLYGASMLEPYLASLGQK